MNSRILPLALAAACAAIAQPAASTPDPVGVYCILEQVIAEPAGDHPERVQLFGVFAFADGPKGEGYGVVQRGYMYYSCPAAGRSTCESDWAEFRWFSGTGKAIGFGWRTAPIGRLRKTDDPAAAPDPYPARGGILKMSAKDDPAYIDLAARLKAAAK